jgi:cell wall-associated NlpC family hydrolase
MMKSFVTKALGTIALATVVFVSNPLSADAALGDRQLKQGMKHNEVKELQVALKKTGHFTYKNGYTTYYGSYTTTAVRNFQKQNKLKVTGIADKNTIKSIKQKAAAKTAAAKRKVTPVKKATVKKMTFNVNAAKKLSGIRYTYGGTSPKTGFDCSGFVTYVMNQHNVKLPRRSQDMYNVGQKVTSLQPGDLVFYNTSGRGVSHVGIYIGNGQMIHSASKNVKVDNMSSSYWKKRYVGAKRVL